MTRERLPNRREAETFELECSGLAYTATYARFADGRVAEVFLRNHKSNSMADTLAKDAAVVCSIALQYGAPLDVLRRALMRDSQGRAERPVRRCARPNRDPGYHRGRDMTVAVRDITASSDVSPVTAPENAPFLPADLDTVAPLTIFSIRCQTLALFVGAGELDLHAAVDLLRDEADANGFDTDTAQAIMNQAFLPAARVRPALRLLVSAALTAAQREQKPDIWPPPNWSEYGPNKLQRRLDRESPATTIDALKYAYTQAQQQGNAKVFEEPANKERIARLSPRQRKELAQWIEAREWSKPA